MIYNIHTFNILAPTHNIIIIIIIIPIKIDTIIILKFC